jgi:predicted DNA-binding transcriptional regulator AlpA
MSNPFEEILQELAEIKQTLSAARNAPAQQIEVIDRPELLKRLGITEPTAITWGKKGRIPEMRIGSNVRYNWPSVVAALENTKR